jgi:hypothetical protein
MVGSFGNQVSPTERARATANPGYSRSAAIEPGFMRLTTALDSSPTRFTSPGPAPLARRNSRENRRWRSVMNRCC